MGNGVTPKHIAVEEQIKRDIKDKIFTENQKLPTEKALSERFGVSRSTIRFILTRLEHQGILKNITYRGFFVKGIEVQRSTEILGFTDLIESQGMVPSSKLIAMERINADERVCEKLNLTPKDMVYRIERIRYANGEAVLLEETFIVADRFNGLQMFNFEKYSLYDVLYEHYGVELTYAKDIINSVWLTKTEAQILLGRDTGHALSTENITYDNDKKPVEYCNMKYNPDKFSYIVTSTKQTKKHATAEGMNKSMENEADKTINAGGNFNG